MKKHRMLIVILSAVLGCILLVVSIFIISGFWRKTESDIGFTLDEEYMDTAYNNAELSSGNLAYADGKLYYNYCPYSKFSGLWNYGTYAITDNGAHRVSWDGPTLYIESSPLHVFQGKLYGRYTEDTSETDSNGSYSNIYMTVTSDNAVYRYTYNDIFRSKDGVNDELIFTQAYDIENRWGNLSYITDKSITYLSKSGHLKEYDFEKQEYILDIDLTPYDMQVTDPYDGITYTVVKPLKCGDKTLLFANQIGEAEYLYEVTDDSLTLLYTREATNAELSGESDFSYYNACGDNVFISTLGKGIDKINVVTGEVTNIVPKGTEDIYVFGEKWIYYTKSDFRLYRTTQDGTVTERIY